MAFLATMKKVKKKPKTQPIIPQNERAELEGSVSSVSIDSTSKQELQEQSLNNDSCAADNVDRQDAWLLSDRDYTYQELLCRISKFLRANNPELAGEKRKINMVLPQVTREGTKKSAFVNVVDVCRKLNRTNEHVIQFLLAELGTTGSVDGAGSLIIKGRFQQKQIEAVIKRYVQEYVQCKTCKSPDTILLKENRLYFQKCEVCGSSRTVSAIKSGFKAQTEKRSAQRNKLTT